LGAVRADMTKVEKQWMNSITELGCICCRLFLGVFSPAEPHHLLSGGRRRGHLFTIPLCPTHHRSGRNDEEVVSRDQNQRRFEKRYGSEESLLARTRELVQRNATLGQPTNGSQG
jgi:hypothetical protein